MTHTVDVNTVEWPASVAIEAERVIAGSPIANTLSMHADSKYDVGMWRCTPGEYTSVRNGYSEFVHIIAGRGRLVHDDGTTYELHPGISAHIDDGWSGRWIIDETIVKAYTIIYA